MQIKEVLSYLNKAFPKETACDFDQNIIGLTIGDDTIEVKKVLLALDLTIETAKEALKIGANLIITHHPFLFNPITKILFNSPQGEIIKFMCENNLTTYSMHTNLDCGVNGVNDTLARMLGLTIDHDIAVKEDMLRFSNIKETTLSKLIETVKKTFLLNGVRYIGDLNKKINTIGILAGSGANNYLIDDAIKAGCDCYITGEVHLNNAIYAKQKDICIIEVNHGIERFVFNSLKEELKNQFGDIFVISNINTDPLMSL